MSYDVKNYTEQGGDVTRIGGKLIIEGDGSIEGLPAISNQGSSSSTTIAALKDDFNGLLNKLKDSGYMTKDSWGTVSIAKLQAEEGEDHKAIFEANQALVSAVALSGDNINITANVDSMQSYESAAGYGNHKWTGILITTGFSSIVGMKLNGSELDSSEAASATAHSGQAGDLVLYLAADTIDGKSFTLWHTGAAERTFTVNISAPASA